MVESWNPADPSLGDCSGPNTGAWPNDAIASCLSEFLSEALTPPRSYLKPKVHNAIPLRTARMKKALPKGLQEFLERLRDSESPACG